jgi:hypothetical protein
MRILTMALAGVILAGGGLPTAIAAGPTETLLPSTTRAFLCVPSVKTLEERWNKTQLGQLAKDPVMKPFIDDLRQQIDERWSDIHERLGVTIEDLLQVAGGELALAAVQTAEGGPAIALVADTTGNQKKAQDLLARISKNLTRASAKHERIQVEGAAVDLFTLPPDEYLRLPKEVAKSPKEVSKPAKGKAKPGEPRPAEPRERHVVYCLKDNLLVGSTEQEVVQGVLARLGGKKGPSLAEVPSYRAVMKRCAEDAGKAVSQVRWYVQPLGYLEIVRALRVETPQSARKGTNIVEFFKEQGFDSIEGLGGLVDFSRDGCEVIHRTAVYAPGKHERSMKLLSFPNRPDPGGAQAQDDPFKPQQWVPADVASYVTFQFDALNAFDNLDTLVDALFGKGEKGVWKDIVTQLEKDPHGPRLNLRKELVEHLGSRVTVLSGCRVPVTTTSERILIAVEIKKDQEKPVADAITKFYKNDKDMRRREFEGHVIWESIPPEKDESGIPKPKLSEVPPIEIDYGGAKKPVRPARTPKREDALFPNVAVTAARGQLLVASHYDFLVQVLGKEEARVKSGDTLVDSIEYQQVTKALDQFKAKAKCARSFVKTDEQYRATYELIRQNKMPESQTMLGRILNAVFGTGKKGVRRKQEIDGSKLPDYDFVRRYLGPGGFQAVTEEKGDFRGWFLKGFILPKGGAS